MKLKTLLILALLLSSVQFTFASFPVKRTIIETENVKNKNEDSKNDIFTPLLSSEKSKGIALILALTLGLLAAHRWYLGCPWFINVFFIMSLGGCGIWLLVDIIRILAGTLKPRARYKKTFF